MTTYEKTYVDHHLSQENGPFQLKQPLDEKVDETQRMNIQSSPNGLHSLQHNVNQVNKNDSLEPNQDVTRVHELNTSVHSQTTAPQQKMEIDEVPSSYTSTITPTITTTTTTLPQIDTCSDVLPDIETFDTIVRTLKTSNLVLAVFYMPKCPACVRFVPLINRWIQQFQRETESKKSPSVSHRISFCRINVYNPKNMDINMFARIRSCPTIGLFWMKESHSSVSVSPSKTTGIALRRMLIPKEWTETKALSDGSAFRVSMDTWTQQNWGVSENGDDLSQVFPPVSEQQQEQMKRKQQEFLASTNKFNENKQIFIRPSLETQREQFRVLQQQKQQQQRQSQQQSPSVTSQTPDQNNQQPVVTTQQTPDKQTVLASPTGNQQINVSSDLHDPSYEIVELPVTWTQIVISVLLCVIFVILFGILISELINFIVPRMFHTSSFKKINWITGLALYTVATILIKH